MIQGFPFQSSVLPGDNVRFHVSTDAPQFRVDIYRRGTSLSLELSSTWFASEQADNPDHAADADWSQDQPDGSRGWPGFDVPIPSTCSSGVYIAMFVEGDGNDNPRGNTPPLDPTTADARYGKALFVVRSPAPGTQATILYKVPLFTYQAYNDVGGWSLYTVPEGKPNFVSLRRPGGGTGGHPWDDWNYDPADRSSARQVFAHWDAPFIGWLEQNGYAIDYATDLDLHTDPNLLAPYPLVLSVGHDEYWSKEMRDQAEAYVQSGGNFAFFSGNTCWWAVEFDGDFRFQRPATWWDGRNRPENSLTGVSSRNGGEGNQDRPKVGYVVQNHDHWIFVGTGLQEGDSFGVQEEIVGYEADGANFDRSQGPPFIPKLDDGTPATFVILGVGDVAGAFGQIGNFNGNFAATMGLYTNAGTVFTGATTDWPRVVGRDGEPVTTQITRNVLNRLAGIAHVQTDVAPGASGSGGNTVVVAKDPDGRIFYTWWPLGSGGRGWHELDGDGRTDAAPAAALVGQNNDYLFAVVKGLDGNVYLNQGTLGQGFVGWGQAGFQTDVAPAAAGSGNNSVIVAKSGDGRIFYTWWPLGSGGQGWQELDGDGRTDAAPAAALVGQNNDYLFAVVKGLDGNVYLNQGTLGQGFVGWAQAGFQTDVAPAAAGSGNNSVIVAKSGDGRIFYTWWPLGSGGQGWQELDGDIRTDDPPAAALVGPDNNYLFVLIRGTDGNLHLNQGVLGQTFVGWQTV